MRLHGKVLYFGKGVIMPTKNKQFVFKNLSTTEKINAWIQEMEKETRSSYPLPPPDGELTGICVDIGSNVGTFLARAATRYQYVYGFEPCLENYQVATHLMEHLGHENVSLFHQAVSSESDRTVKLYAHESRISGDVVCSAGFLSDPHYIPVGQTCDTISLNDIIERIPLSHIDYLKIDAEGSEYEIFQTFKYYNKINTMALELHGHPDPAKNDDEEKVKLLEKLSTYFWILPVDAEFNGTYGVQPFSQFARNYEIKDLLKYTNFVFQTRYKYLA